MGICRVLVLVLVLVLVNDLDATLSLLLVLVLVLVVLVLVLVWVLVLLLALVLVLISGSISGLFPCVKGFLAWHSLLAAMGYPTSVDGNTPPNAAGGDSWYHNLVLGQGNV
jgi:hypothetical protein